MPRNKRKIKNKKEIVSDLQLVQDSTRRRSLVRDILFPYLLKMDDTVGYTKIFIQAFNAMVNGAYEAEAKKTTIGMLTPQLDNKLRDIFKMTDPIQLKEYDKYHNLIELLKDVSVQDLEYATQLPRYIDGFLLQDKNKEKISIIDINKILG